MMSVLTYDMRAFFTRMGFVVPAALIGGVATKTIIVSLPTSYKYCVLQFMAG